MSQIVTIYVPRAGGVAEQTVAPGSAIVGRALPGKELIDCWYEGSADLTAYVQRLYHAAGRMRENYPTIARSAFPKDSVVAVGSYDLDRLVVVEVSDTDALCAWAGEAVEDITGIELPVGRIDWQDAFASLEREGKRPIQLSSTEFLYRLLSGQILHLDAIRRTAFVFTHDDPHLHSMIAQNPRISAVQRRLLCGTEDAAAPSP